MIRQLLVAVAAAGLLPSVALGATATLYKSPSCGCCAVYVEHLERYDYDVEVEHPSDLYGVKARHGVARELASCHTMVLDGYAFEGHVPVDAIERVLSERPRIRGLAVPGMPTGSPGMNGELRPPLEVVTLEGERFANYYTLPEWPQGQ